MQFFPLFSMEKSMREKLVIGEVLKPQGIRGELKIKPLLDDAEDIRCFRTVWIGGAEYKVMSARVDASAAYLMLSGIADRDAAERLRGKEVEASRADAPALEEGRYYIVDIVGCAVVTAAGKRLGTIADVMSAHTDVYVLRDGEREVLFPAAEGVIEAVDVENKIITVNEARFLQVAVEQ